MTRRRSAGEGTVFFWQQKGLWVGRITLPDGKKRVKTSKTQKIVKDWVLVERNKIKQGIFTTGENITLETFLIRYLEDYGKRSLRITTYEGYKQVIERHIIPDLGKVKLKDLRADQINYLITKKLNAGLSNRSVEYIHGILKRSLNVAKTWELISKNPATLVSPPKVTFKIPDIWSSEQVRLFLDSLKDDRWEAIYYLACTAMRKGEVLGLPLKALDVDKGYLMVIQNLQYVPGRGLLLLEPKTEKSKRLIKLPDFIVEALKKHLARRAMLAQSSNWKESGLVFTTDIGTPISPRNMVRHFKNKIEAIGLPDIRFHDIRHSIVSYLLIEKNLNVKFVSELVGHSSSKVTMDRYAHLINPMNSLVADSLEGLSIPSGLP